MTMDSRTFLLSQRLGLGCGRLKGGQDKARGLRLVHAALDLGIRHFDTAPPYGLGASESVLGEALKGRQEPVTVFTKAGLGRPASPGLLQAARAMVKPLADRWPGLRKAVLGGMAHRAAPARFDPVFVARSIETSLRLLQIDRLDGLLLHEAHPNDNLAPLWPLFDRLVSDGRLGLYGSSTGEGAARLVRFGQVSQYRCVVPGSEEGPSAPTDVQHGALRFVAPAIARHMGLDHHLRDQLASLLPARADPASASGALALAYVLARTPGRLLFSTDQPQRLVATLKQLVHITGSPEWRPAMLALHSAFAQAGTACAH